MRLSIVIPAYNEKDTILEIIEKVKSVSLPEQIKEKEIILVDDCSKDGTRDLLQKISDPDIRIFYHEVNKGKGGALSTGFKEAAGDIVIIQDAEKQAIRHQGMEMWMPSCIVPKCLNYHDNTWNSVLFSQDRFQKLRYTLRSTLAQFPKQLSVIEEELTNNFWYAKDILPMWNRKYYRFFEMMGKLNHLFTMA